MSEEIFVTNLFEYSNIGIDSSHSCIKLPGKVKNIIWQSDTTHIALGNEKLVGEMKQTVEEMKQFVG